MKTKLLSWFAQVSVNHSKKVLTLAAGLTVCAGILSEQLAIRANMKDLMPQCHPAVKEYNLLTEKFQSASNVIIAAIGKTEDLKHFADDVAPQVAALKQYVYRVDYKVNRDFLRQHGMMLMKTKDLKTSVSSYEHLGLQGFLTGINDNFEETYIADGESISNAERENNAITTLDGIQTWLQTMRGYLMHQDSTAASAHEAVDQMLLGEEYMLSPAKDMILLTVFPKFTIDDIDQSTQLVHAIEDIIHPAAAQYRGIEQVGMAGAMALGVDETRVLSEDSNITSVVAFVLIILLFVVSFRRWSAPLLAGVSLLAGIIWTTGFAALAVGHLNIMTSIFGVILIGLGIDFNIHIISGYLENRAAGMDVPTAMKITFAKAGGGVLVGAFTTSLAFFTLMIAENAGMKEFGLISGTGVLLTMLSSFTVLPAWLAWLDLTRQKKIRKLQVQLGTVAPQTVQYYQLINRIEKKSRRVAQLQTPSFWRLGSLSEKIGRQPVLYLSIAIALSALAMLQARHIRFNYDFMSLEPKGLTSVALQDAIIGKFNMSPDMVFVSAPSVAAARTIAQQAKEVPRIGLTNTISDYVPSDQQYQERLPYLAQIQQYLQHNAADTLAPNEADMLIDQLYRLEDNVIEMAQMAFAGGQDRVDAKAKEIAGDLTIPVAQRHRLVQQLVDLIQHHPTRAVQALNVFQAHYEPYLRRTAASMSTSDKITLDQIPDDILAQFISKDGTQFLVTMFPKEQIWNLNFLKHFSARMHQIDQRITGTPIIYYILIVLIGEDGTLAAALTLLVIFIILLLDFRSLKFSLLTMVPLVLGTLWMVGIMEMIGMKLNLLNVMGLPLILGMGVDDGVHIMHRYRMEGPHHIKHIFSSTGKAVLITSLTTFLAFGALAFSSHRGLASLGATLAIGIITMLLATLVVLPAIIALMDHKKSIIAHTENIAS